MKRIRFSLLLSCSIILSGPVFAKEYKKVIVGSEDTVYSIAYHNGLQTHAVISANNLKPPYTLRPGQTIIIPSSGEHIAGDGENLHSIAEKYGVRPESLASANNLHQPYFITPGDLLVIPTHDTETVVEALKAPAEETIATSSLEPLPLVPLGTKVHESSFETEQNVPLPDDLADELAAEKAAPAPKKTASTKSSKKPPLMGDLSKQASETKKVAKMEKTEEKSAEPSKKENKKQADATPKEIKKPKKQELTFDWPVTGEVIGNFKAGENDSIDIAVPEGTAVKAAADGKVMYAGSELKGFGNLLLVKHEGGWVTAYAHNKTLVVGKGDKVQKGDTIAKSGVKKDSGIAMVHFEVREGKKPQPPLTKLP